MKRRQQAASAARSEADFNLDRNCHFRQIYEHTEQALDRSLVNVPLATKALGCVVEWDRVASSLAGSVDKLLRAIDRLSGVAAATSEAAACDEMGLVLCELLDGHQCDVLPVSMSEDELPMLELSPTFFIRQDSHGIFGRTVGVTKPVSLSDVGTKLGAQLSMIEWFEARAGKC